MTATPVKQPISPNALRRDSHKLGAQVVVSGFKPDFMVALWRGGAPIGCYVHEFLKYFNINTDHIAIRTSRYSGIDKTASQIEVHNLGYLVERLKSTSKVLLVDDVYDSGLSIQAVFDALKSKLGNNYPVDIRVATIHFKPTRNKTTRVPEYYVHKTDSWLVYPHELEGLTDAEIYQFFGEEIGDLIKETGRLLAESEDSTS